MIRASHPNEGRVAIVTNAAWDAVDANVPTDERHNCGRRSRVVLTPRRWRQALASLQGRRWQESPVTEESTKETVTPSRRESRICPVDLWFLTPVLFYLHRRPRVQSAPGFPCALAFQEGETSDKPRVSHAARTRSHVALSCHRPRRRATQYPTGVHALVERPRRTGFPAFEPVKESGLARKVVVGTR